MFHNKSSTMAQRTRMPVRRAAASINDENKVGAATAPRGVKGIEPVKAVGAVRPAAAVGLGARLASKPTAAAGPAKAFGVPAAAAATNPRTRSALGEIGNTKVQGIVSRLAKPNDVVAKIQAKVPVKAGRVAVSGVSKPAISSTLVRQPIAVAAVAAAVAAAGRPTVSVVRAPVLSARPISRPGPSFGLRRARHGDDIAATESVATEPMAASAAAGAALSKRARTASASLAASTTTSLLGKHTRSGRVTRSASSDPALPIAGARLDTRVAAESGNESTDEAASTVVGSSATSLKLESSLSSPDTADLGELKLVDVDTIDYALVHTGLLNEHPIMMAEINEFEADVDPLDSTQVSEFSDDIFGYMRELEVRLMPDDQYIARQPALSWSTRAVLVEWLVQVHQRFDLLPETLYLCFNFIDRFLSIKEIMINKLQLVGVVCLLLAAKYEEMFVPSIEDIVFMVENNYSAAEILRAERYILRMLNFDLGWPGPMSFLRRISKADEYDMQTRTLAKYLMEVTLIDERFIGVPCSQMAATAHYLSLRFLDKGPWTRAHAFYSGYFESELIPLATSLVEQLMQPRKHRSIFEKYAARRFMRGSEYIYCWFKTYRPESLLMPIGADRVPEPVEAASGLVAAGAEEPIF
ncbi:B-type cyclin [Coemansia biformis]|uniref:B-type cyclin n=1 Tax=Coemansia biformis TaxID=1286918 RepID=A0A9W7Y9B7_9FUNG|nr:B-type cyclin [Coemansia biformis]